MDAVETLVYRPEDIQKMLALCKTTTYGYLNKVSEMPNPPFKVIKIGTCIRVSKTSFDKFMEG